MRLTKFALGSAAAVVVTGLLSAAPACAFTFHPATPAEIKQTDDLNAQALQAARSGAAPVGFKSDAAGTIDNGTVQGSGDSSMTPAPSTGMSNTPSTQPPASPDTAASPPSKTPPPDGQ